MKESVFQRKVRDFLVKDRNARLARFSTPSWPDYICFPESRAVRPFFLEIKAEGYILRPDQEALRDYFEDRGEIYLVVTSGTKNWKDSLDQFLFEYD